VSHTYTIKVFNDLAAEIDEELYLSCMRRISIFASSGHVNSAAIYIAKPFESGWTEYIVHTFFENSATPFVVGVLRRFAGASIEWHS
jgi:hypothetical protein